ncbi:GLUG motif-containing protein [Planococcus sp. YIM B11945]|uniref:GLUG motif-containing protein n=1 Tax=Planococcus sp. YIM B11945 TaxID=3435410 RepID=UPI003D7D6CC4
MLGSGTIASPYQVSTIADLNAVRNNLTAHYKLMNDIDLSSVANFVPIGADYNNSFRGVFDGNGKKIKNLTIYKTTVNIGLFAYVREGTVKNLALVDCSVKGKSDTNYVGGITGYTTSKSTIDQCSVTGEIFGQYGVGGLVGWHVESTVSNSWASCKVDGAGRVGGLVGNITNSLGFIRNSYTYGTGTATGSGYESMALTGDLLSGATAANNVTDSFYNVDTNSKSQSGTPLTTSQFADPSNFSSWDSSIWGFADYPYLKVFGVPSLPAKKVTATVTSHLGIVLSSLSRSKRKLQSVVTSTQSISSSVSKRATAIAESMIDDIVSNVEALANANIKTHIVSSKVSGIGSNASRIVKAIRTVESTMQPVRIVTEIIVPFKEEQPVYAMIYIIENQSNVNLMTNETNTELRENATEMSVI